MPQRHLAADDEDAMAAKCNIHPRLCFEDDPQVCATTLLGRAAARRLSVGCGVR